MAKPWHRFDRISRLLSAARWRFVMVVGMVAGASACATLSPEQCEFADWHQIGSNDGRQGYRASQRLGRHSEACAEVGIRPDRAAYRRGYAEGLQLYCVPSMAYRHGSEGASDLPDVCPVVALIELEEPFRAGRELAHLLDRRDRLLRQSDDLLEVLTEPELSEREQEATRREIRQVERELA